jgi:short-subunit dehydrogenase
MSKTVLITGASDGIGFEIARKSVDLGYTVFMLARDPERLRRAADNIMGPMRPRIMAVDLTDERSRKAFLIFMEEAELVPDILVNNAGIGSAGEYAEVPWEKLETLFRLNMLAVAHINHWALKRMKARGSGAIVNMSSAVATRPSPYFAAYAASKAFINSLSQALYVEARPFGVSVSVVHPPEVRTRPNVNRQKADLSGTLALRLLPSIADYTVAKVVLKAAHGGQRSVAPGIITWLAMSTAGKLPEWFDLMLMTQLFKQRSWLQPKPKELL